MLYVLYTTTMFTCWSLRDGLVYGSSISTHNRTRRLCPRWLDSNNRRDAASNPPPVRCLDRQRPTFAARPPGKTRARGWWIASPAPPKKKHRENEGLNDWTNNFVEKNMRLLSNKLAWGGWASTWKLLTSEKEKLSRRFWAWVKLTSHFGHCLIRPSRIFTR